MRVMTHASKFKHLPKESWICINEIRIHDDSLPKNRAVSTVESHKKRWQSRVPNASSPLMLSNWTHSRSQKSLPPMERLSQSKPLSNPAGWNLTAQIRCILGGLVIPNMAHSASHPCSEGALVGREHWRSSLKPCVGSPRFATNPLTKATMTQQWKDEPKVCLESG